MTPAKVKYLDRLFGLMIRRKRKVCAMCGKDDGTLQVSHRFGRANRSVRWDERNVDLFCDKHHREWERMPKDERAAYMMATLGLAGYVMLVADMTKARKWTDAEVNEMAKRFKE